MNRIVTLGLICMTLMTTLLSADAQRQRRQTVTGQKSIAVLPLRIHRPVAGGCAGGVQAAQDVFVTELVSSKRFRVITREQLQAFMKKNNLALSGDIDPSATAKIGKQAGINYLLTGSVTEYGSTDASRGGSISSRKSARSGAKLSAIGVKVSLIDTSTGEIVWADEAKVSVFGVGGGVDDNRMYRKTLQSCAHQLMLKAPKASK